MTGRVWGFEDDSVAKGWWIYPILNHLSLADLTSSLEFEGVVLSAA
jgi:hypothetical protein